MTERADIRADAPAESRRERRLSRQAGAQPPSAPKAGASGTAPEAASARPGTAGGSGATARSRPARMGPSGRPGTRAGGKAAAPAQHAARKGVSRPAPGETRAPSPAAKTETPAGKRKGKAARAKSSTTERVVCAALSLLFLGTMAFLGWRIRQQEVAYAHFQEMKQVVENQTFYPGTTVDGIDVSGKTLKAAQDYWRQQVEPSYSNRTVTLNNGLSVTAAQLGYASDFESVLTNAWSAGRRGSLESRYIAAVSRSQQPAAFQVTRALYDKKRISACVDELAGKVDRPARDASLKGFNAKKLTFSFEEAQVGRRLDAAALKRDMAAALEAGGGKVTARIEKLEPKVTAKMLKKQYGKITTATTNASSSAPNRLSNIRRALELINGTCLEPGQTFSFNKAVGQRTTDRGFKMATAYSSGDVTEEVGGGICQVSTTLFNAAVKADLKIVERHNHSLTVSYVESGKDATVNWGSQDLRFKNNSGEKMYIACYLSKDKRVRVAMYGKLLPNGESITVEAETTELIDYDTDLQPTDTLSKGKKEVVSAGKQGCKAVAYKVRWDGKGNELSREVLCKSFYRAKNEVVAVGA